MLAPRKGPRRGTMCTSCGLRLLSALHSRLGLRLWLHRSGRLAQRDEGLSLRVGLLTCLLYVRLYSSIAELVHKSDLVVVGHFVECVQRIPDSACTQDSKTNCQTSSTPCTSLYMCNTTNTAYRKRLSLPSWHCFVYL